MSKAGNFSYKRERGRGVKEKLR